MGFWKIKNKPQRSWRTRRKIIYGKKFSVTPALSVVKNHILIVLAGLCLALPSQAPASWNLSADVDARYRWEDWEHSEANLHLVGASVRKTFADSLGDRFIFFGLVEAEDNFDEIVAHELYGQYKGPLGAWNVTAGRFGLPWGLLPGFSASRLLYDMPHDRLLGMDVDSGLKASGVVGSLDYGFSFTQGYGPHHTPHDMGYGLAVGRVGFTPGDTDEISLGLSAAWGRSLLAHDEDDRPKMTEMTEMTEKDADRDVLRALGGVDATLYLGRFLGRIEVAGGRVDHRALTTAFAALDYALLPKLDLNLAVNTAWHGSDYEDAWFVGFTGNPPWFTIRGGYTYADESDARHTVTLQIYRLFSWSY